MATKYVAAHMDEAVAQFVCSRIPGMDLERSPYTAIGQLDHLGNIIGGVVFNNYVDGRDIHMHTAGTGPRCLTRRFIGEVFRYVFVQLGCRRCTGLVARSNEHAAIFDQKLGFRYEGVLRAYLAGDEDVLIFGMLREECRWLKVGELKYGSNQRARGASGESITVERRQPATTIPLRRIERPATRQ